MKGQQSWTSEQDQQLRELAKAGNSADEISDKMRRSVGSIRHRATVIAVKIAKKPRHLR